MHSYTNTDLEQLAAGKRVSAAAFRAILTDPEALAELAKLVQLRELFDLSMPAADIDSAEAPVMELSFTELAGALEGTLSDPARNAAAQALLQAELPAFCPAEAPVANAENSTSDSVSASSAQAPSIAGTDAFILTLKEVLDHPAVRAAVGRIAHGQISHELPRAGSTTGTGAVRWQSLSRFMKLSLVAASLLLACLAGSTAISAVAAAHQAADAREFRYLLSRAKEESDQLRSRLDSSLAELERLRKVVSPKRPTPDSSRRQLDRGREYSLPKGDTPDQLAIQLSPFLGQPYYNGLEVIWGDDSKPAREEVYNVGYTKLKPLITHSYKLPQPGDQRRVTVQLIYRLSGHAMHKFGLKDGVIIETIPLVLTSKGIRVATGRAVDAVSAAITNPAVDDAEVPSEFTLEMSLQAPPRSQTSPGAAPEDRIIHVLIRPLDGPEKLRNAYVVQPFTQSVLDLQDLGGSAELQLTTWVALPGVVPNGKVGQPGPRHFEILVVELPKLLVASEISRELMDFSDKQLKEEAVRAERVVRLRPESKKPHDRRPEQ